MRLPARSPRGIVLDVRGGRFLLATIDGGGTGPPELGLAARLVQRGHQVRVLADPTLESGASAAGCEFSPWRTAPHVSSVQEQTAVLTEMERGGPVRQFRMARDRYISGPARQFADDVVSVTREHPVDAVMVEAVLSGALVGAAATGMPRVALMPNVYMMPAPGRPPFGTGWSPGKGRLGRARDTVANAAMRRVFASFTPGVNVARAAYGLPAIPDMFALLDECDRVLVLSSPAFDFPAPALPSNVRYVGAQLDDPHWAAGDDWRPPGSDPLVLVATSSTFQSQVDALAQDRRGAQPAPSAGCDHDRTGGGAGRGAGAVERPRRSSRTPHAGAARSVRRPHPCRTRQHAEGVGRGCSARVHADGPGPEGQHGTRPAPRRRRADRQARAGQRHRLSGAAGPDPAVLHRGRTTILRNVARRSDPPAGCRLGGRTTTDPAVTWYPAAASGGGRTITDSRRKPSPQRPRNHNSDVCRSHTAASDERGLGTVGRISPWCSAGTTEVPDADQAARAFALIGAT